MIAFYRRIRQKLIKDSKLSKYLIYALGEIALVMIGILLALQVNNWNENRQSRLSENKALVELKEEFKTNHERLTMLMDIKKNQEEQFRSYINVIISDDITLNQKMNTDYPSANRAKWGNVNTVLSGLLNSGGIDNIQNDSLKLLLHHWPVATNRFIAYEEELAVGLTEWRSFLNELVPQKFVTEGDYRGEWPGNAHAPKMATKINQYKSSMIESLQHYNMLGDVVNRLYIYLIIATELTDRYESIINLLDQELSLRSN